ncbi:MAG TPA: PIN domain-containing protein [Candidatus Nanoarchaeia archaeon]|nr:PIN domain-containing protein [Candidatus Nanoarchaeia archaeon]
MNGNYVMDTSAWIEYFSGTQKGVKISHIIKDKPVFTSVIAIAELAEKHEREERPFESRFEFIKNRSSIISIEIRTALLGAKLKNKIRKFNPKFGLANAFHLATAQQENAVLVTCDRDFQGIENVMLI